MTDTIRVAIIDDQELVRMGLRMVLDAQPDISVVAEAGDGNAAVALATGGGIDVMLMDVRMPGLDGIAATDRITATGSVPRVLVLTTFDLDEYAFAALRAGASGFLLKDARPPELLGAIRAVHSGDAALAPRVTARMIETFVEGPAPIDDARLEVLTPREHEILVAIGEGLTNDELAARFFLSISTVKTHISRLLQKLDARDRVQLVIIAYEAGLVGR
ncbi:DNA-binding response regulator [Microbacterium sorbitolivorans]|uniref:DNA-binding response regulator n=1 Tax=Microbacterium sorbitolivorans TaxID=1867410 RepID=A0A367XXJ6_9MICO|nr:response regulator transcription factor [Microbacterium sorbitolivorans]RCK58337.1 DNA-binding response regulator [Microbacterium sorbitolivorans]GGF35664.1 DNA-binding response regulator [Microbacterium sorbitolivorans]